MSAPQALVAATIELAGGTVTANITTEAADGPWWIE